MIIYLVICSVVSLFIFISIPCFTSLHFTSLHFTSLHFTSLHFTSLHFTSLHFSSLLFSSLLFSSLLFSSLLFSSLLFSSLLFSSLLFFPFSPSFSSPLFLFQPNVPESKMLLAVRRMNRINEIQRILSSQFKVSLFLSTNSPLLLIPLPHHYLQHRQF